MVGQHKSWDEVLIQERHENSRLKEVQRDQAERERQLNERLTQLKEQQQALQQGNTVDAVDRDGKVKALQVRTTAHPLQKPAEACVVGFRGCLCLLANCCWGQVLNNPWCAATTEQDRLAYLNQQHTELEAKLQTAKMGQPGGGKGSHVSAASAGPRSASRPGSASKGKALPALPSW